jgi:hypothetical protein
VRRRSSTRSALAASVPAIDESSTITVHYSQLSAEQEVLLLQCLECHGWPAAAALLTAEAQYKKAKLPAMSSTAVASLFAAVATAAAAADTADSASYVPTGGASRTVYSAQLNMLASAAFRALAQRKLQQCAAAGGMFEVAGTELLELLRSTSKDSSVSSVDDDSWAVLKASYWSSELDKKLLQGLLKHGFELSST